MTCYNSELPIGPPGPTGPAGPQGTIGPQGFNGTIRLYSNLNDSYESTIVDAWVPQYNYTVAANTLVNDGDSLVINLRSLRLSDVGGLNTAYRRITFSGQSCTFAYVDEVSMLEANPFYQYNTTVEIVKSGINTALCIVMADASVYSDDAARYEVYKYQRNLTGLNFTIDNAIVTDLQQSEPLQVYFKSITIDKLTAF